MEPTADAAHHSTYRVILALIAVALPIAGVLAWSGPMLYDVFAVRIGVSLVCVGVLAATWRDGRLLRAATGSLAVFLVGWFLWVGRVHAMTVDDVVGLIPLVLLLALLVRTPAELGGAVGFVGAGLGLAYLGLDAPAFPPAIVALLFGAMLVSMGWMSISRGRLEARLAQANEDLERRVRERTAALQSSEAEARRANEAKSVFLANMSHELRTPLTAIVGYVEIALEDLEDAPGVREDLGRAGQAAHHLLALIDDLLDLARIESGHLDLASDVVPVRAVVDGAVRLVSSALQARGNAVTVEVPDDLRVRADADRARQVLVNLLANAAKFTEGGQVTVRATGEGDGVHLSVSDTGVGMAPDVLARAFDRFAQGDPSATRRHGGAGLGLAIARELVERMGGRLVGESEVGRGSTLTVVLPAA